MTGDPASRDRSIGGTRSGARSRRRRGRTPGFEALEGRVVPATIAVTTTDDAGPGSLRAAILQADADPGPDAITFAPGVVGSIALASALPDLTASMTLAGPGAAALTVAPSTGYFRIFTVAAGVDVSISGLTIMGGRAVTGGGIRNSGTLTLAASFLAADAAAAGGGVANDGTMTVTDCTFGGDSAGGFFAFNPAQGGFVSGGGGGITNSGTMTITASAFSGDQAGGGEGGIFFGGGGVGAGGGISNSGTLTITASTLTGNSAGGGGSPLAVGAGEGGGIENDGMLSVIDSTLAGNQANGGAGGGGGISNSGSLMVTASALNGNSARGSNGATGGGIFNSNGVLTVVASTLSGNVASGGSSDYGGGIANGGTATITDSTLGGNSAVPDARLTGNSTFTYGGGIADSGTLTIVATTLVGNSASSAGGGVYAYDPGGMGTPPVARVLAISCLFANPEGGNLVAMTGVAFTSLGHNLFSDAPDVPLTATDLQDIDALLGPLADNGGPTFTQALLPGSPAIAAGAAIAGVTTDQRGIPRPAGVAPDIGAFQSRGFTLALAGGAGQRVPLGSAFPAPLAVLVTSPFGEPVGGGRVTFSAPLSGPAALLSNRLVPIGGDGRAVVTASAAGATGTYAVDASAAGAEVVAFALTNTAPLAIAVSPATGTGLAGGAHTVTATASDPSGKPRAGVAVTFRVVAGPDAGVAEATVRTDAAGRARFTYANTHGAGTDVIAAAATLPGGVVVQAPRSTVAWALPRVALGPATGSAAAGGTATLTANLTTAGGSPLAGIPVTFRVVAGPNAGAAVATVRTDAAGHARFTYADARGPGTDIIVAPAAFPGGITVDSGRVIRTWIMPAPAPPPTVAGLRRFGFHAQPTSLALAFRGPLDPARAEDLANYALVGPVGGRGRGGHPIAIGRAIYDASTDTVTLLPARGLNVHDHYRLTIRGTGPAGVAGPSGVLLDGAGNGRPGSDRVITFGRESLAGPAAAAAQSQPRP